MSAPDPSDRHGGAHQTPALTDDACRQAHHRLVTVERRTADLYRRPPSPANRRFGRHPSDWMAALTGVWLAIVEMIVWPWRPGEEIDL